MLAVDESGAEVDGDQIMAVCAAQLKSKGLLPHDTVVGTVMTNLGFDVAMRELGVTTVKTKVGDRYVLDQMRMTGAMLGGEQSGHIIFLEHETTGDGLITGLQLAAVMKATGRPLSELAKVMTRYPQVLVNVRVDRHGPPDDEQRAGRGHRCRRAPRWARQVACSSGPRARSLSCA